MAGSKGSIEIDKTLAIVLGVIGLALIVFFLLNAFSDATGLYNSLFPVAE